MTKETNLQKLREAIIKEIPEIMELGVDCFGVYKGKKCIVISEKINDYSFTYFCIGMYPYNYDSFCINIWGHS